MFGIGMQELLIILVVALLFVGPSKLPEMARSIGKGLRELRRASDDLRSAIMLDDDDAPARRRAPPSAPAEVPPAIHGSVVATAREDLVSRGGDEHEGAAENEPGAAPGGAEPNAEPNAEPGATASADKDARA